MQIIAFNDRINTMTVRAKVMIRSISRKSILHFMEIYIHVNATITTD